MRRASEQTTSARVIAGALFSYLAPSITLGMVYDQFAPGGSHNNSEAANVILGALVFGLLLGWPYLAVGLTAWAILDQIERHYPWAAALVGLAAGAGVAGFSFRDGLFFKLPIAWPLCTGVGLLTGLGVWWIAYGLQGLVKPATKPPKSRLVL
ncbi:hypothetical protein [Caulobacter hibisci]|uniref:Uncharacterized protein n=1 Tax=Caulobacter hibisci TaxID=2035993 RepID=A0ABS0T1N0_9CAUL|nr:hypothetical protein [Caulobacter hibisci]MBI1685787.1 hypothetical protein [Caulobacter hibisci]